mmetsp:Transcript_11321/g.32617  ORF Transcript_11321/g.32617 Transcript_11321/m.32617 type:complete len:324 (-) Transcript_11321:235-1206(-)
MDTRTWHNLFLFSRGTFSNSKIEFTTDYFIVWFHCVCVLVFQRITSQNSDAAGSSLSLSLSPPIPMDRYSNPSWMSLNDEGTTTFGAAPAPAPAWAPSIASSNDTAKGSDEVTTIAVVDNGASPSRRSSMPPVSVSRGATSTSTLVVVRGLKNMRECCRMRNRSSSKCRTRIETGAPLLPNRAANHVSDAMENNGSAPISTSARGGSCSCFSSVLLLLLLLFSSPNNAPRSFPSVLPSPSFVSTEDGISSVWVSFLSSSSSPSGISPTTVTSGSVSSSLEFQLELEPPNTLNCNFVSRHRLPNIMWVWDRSMMFLTFSSSAST